MQRTSSATACGCDAPITFCDEGKRLLLHAEITSVAFDLEGDVAREPYRAALEALFSHTQEASRAANE